ncbi:MAG: tetratricopeptide repeat protein [Phycisphaerales bacterium]|nr:MAG: tetratricopeptide repeat protein [Phycisphaerales bacterium]
MKDIQSRKSGVCVGLCVGILLGAFCLGGCSESAAPVPTSEWAQGSSDLDFQAQADRPPTAKTLWAMADILATQGKDSECEYVLKRVIQSDPEFLLAYNSLAELQMRGGHTNAAIQTLQEALRICPDDPVLLNNLGMCRLVRRDYENALRVFNKAAAIAPENMKYRANMAVALGLMGREEEALALFRQVLPEDQTVHNLSVLREASKSEKLAPTAPGDSRLP